MQETNERVTMMARFLCTFRQGGKGCELQASTRFVIVGLAMQDGQPDAEIAGPVCEHHAEYLRAHLLPRPPTDHRSSGNG